MSEDVELEPEIPETEEGPRRRSHSQLSSYIQCSERFRLERVIRPRPPSMPAPWLTMGLAVHEALDMWEKSGRTSDMMADYLDAYHRIKGEQLAEQPNLNMWINPYRTKSVFQALDAYMEKGVAQIEAYLGWRDDPSHRLEPMIDPEDGSAWVEVPFEITLGDVPVIGFIDIVDENGGPTDIKTGNRMKTTLQLGVYKVALEKQYGITSDRAAFFYTKDGALVEKTDMSRYTEEYLTELFMTAERGIANEVFLPNVSDFCGLCPVKRFCRELGDQPVPLDFESIPMEERWWGPPNHTEENQ